ncbi:MAG: radical SAM protein [Planctomycetes bacterium]|nr:radical SAM protein [Planctomycetota bacterium]
MAQSTDTPGSVAYRSTPRVLHLNLTARCNIACRICKSPGHEFSMNDPSLAHPLVEDVVAQTFAGLEQLRLDSSGELFLSPELPFVLEQATRHGVPVFISTNGMLVDEARSSSLCASSVRHVQVSVDSPEPETFEWIRKGARFDAVMRGVDRLAAARRTAGRESSLKLEFHAALLAQNFRQLPDLVRLAHERGFDGVSWAYAWIKHYMGVDWAVYWEQDACDQHVSEAAALARSLGMTFSGPASFASDRWIRPPEPCRYAIEWSYVEPDGRIYPCCIGALGYECGDLRRESFTEIWHGDRYRRLRDTIGTDAPAFDKCASCYIATDWHPSDAHAHFDARHWPVVDERAATLSPWRGWCRVDEYRLPGGLASELRDAVTATFAGEHARALALVEACAERFPDDLDLRAYRAELAARACPGRVAEATPSRCYTATVPDSLRDTACARPAEVQVTEDGVELPFSDVSHAEIRRLGAGRYSVWGETVYLSTRDHSDPRTNGRTYGIHGDGVDARLVDFTPNA